MIEFVNINLELYIFTYPLGYIKIDMYPIHI